MAVRLINIMIAVGAAFLAPALAAGESPPTGLAAPEVDACALLGRSEISQVVGVSVGPGERRDDGPQANGSYSATCIWKVEDTAQSAPDPSAPLGGQRFVILMVMRCPAGSGLEHTFLDAFRKAAVEGEIAGTPSPRKFGDEALWWGDGLAVRDGDVSFGISVFIPDSQVRYPGEREERLARSILQRISQHD